MSLTLDNTLAHLPAVERGYALVMNADGKKGDRLTYTNKKSVFLRSLEDLTKSRIFAGEHKGNTTVAKASPNGEWIASGDDHGTLIVWGQGNMMVKCNTGINKKINDIAWDADGKRIVAGGAGSECVAKCVNWDSGSALGTVGGHNKAILSVDYKPTRPFRIVTGGEDMKINLHEGPPFKYKRKNTEHSNYVNKLKFSPNGEQYCSVSSDKTIRIYESKEGELVKTLESKEDGHTGSIYSFAWSPDSTKVLTCGADKTAKLWNVESGAVESTWTFGKDVTDMQMSATWFKDYIMTVSLSGALNFLDAANPGQIKSTVYGHTTEVNDLAIDHATKKFYTCDSNGVICAWENSTASWFTGKGHKKNITAVALSHDGSKLASVGLDDKLRINDCKTMEFDETGVPLGGAPGSVVCGTKSDVVVVGTSKDVLVIVKDGNASNFKVPAKATSLAFTPDESKLAVGFEKGGVKVYDYAGGDLKLAYELKQLGKRVSTVAWSPCGKFLSASGDDRQILVFDGETQLNKSDWEFHQGAVQGHAFSPSGKRVASVGNDLNVFVWFDTEKWGTKKAKQDMSHREGIKKVGFVDDDTLVTVGGDACLKIWKIAQ